MAVLPPLHARARRLLVAALAAAVCGSGLGYLVAIWPAPEPFRAPFVDDRALYAVDVYAAPLKKDPRCVLFLDEWMRHPNWQLTITVGAEDGCMQSDSIHDSDEFLTLDSAGQATWWSRGGARKTMHLPPTMLERLHKAATASCEFPESVEGEPFDYRFVTLRWGGTVEAPGPKIRARSAAFTVLTSFVDAARDLHD